MSSPRQRDPKDPLYDPNDKYNAYKVDLHTNETHSPDEWDPKQRVRFQTHQNVIKIKF